MNKMVLRNIGLIYSEINNYPKEPGHFTPYFQYLIGPYKDDFILYFPKIPDAILYYNSIFLKLWAYNPQDAVKYIEENYTAYSDKTDFLQFLKRQLQHRMNALKKRGKKFSISAICLEWVNEQLAELKDNQKILVYNQFIRQDLSIIVKNELMNAQIPGDDPNGVSAEKLTNQISASLQSKLDSILENTESKIMALADKYETGNIQLTNLSMKAKLIGLFLCLKNLTGKPSRRNKPGDSLMEMDLNDIAQILRLHFAPYKGQKIDSIEKRVYEVNADFKSDNPAYQNLSNALQKYFFNS